MMCYRFEAPAIGVHHKGRIIPWMIVPASPRRPVVTSPQRQTLVVPKLDCIRRSRNESDMHSLCVSHSFILVRLSFIKANPKLGFAISPVPSCEVPAFIQVHQPRVAKDAE